MGRGKERKIDRKIEREKESQRESLNKVEKRGGVFLRLCLGIVGCIS